MAVKLAFPVSREAYEEAIESARADVSFHDELVKKFTDFLIEFADGEDVQKWMIERFDKASPKYGPLFLVCERSWNREAMEELVDFFAYMMINREKMKALGAVPVGR